MIEQPFGPADVTLERRETCYQGFFSLERFHYRFKRFDGTWNNCVQREVFLRGSATCVLPYDRQLDQVLLIEQVRAGALLEPGSPWLIELIAGINDKDETPETIARREALEEAGIELGRLRLINEYFPSPGGSTEKVFLFCAEADLSNAGGIYGLAEEDEDIRVHVVGLDEAYQMVTDGQIDNSPAIIALQWLMIHRQEVLKQWASHSG